MRFMMEGAATASPFGREGSPSIWRRGGGHRLRRFPSPRAASLRRIGLPPSA